VRAPRQGQLDVEIVETDDEHPPPEVEPGPDWRELLRRVRGRTWAVAAGVVALAIAVTGFVGWLGDRAQTDRLTRTEGLTASLGEPLREVWRAPADEVLGVVGDMVVLRSGERVAGVGAADGRTRWEHVTTGSGVCWLAHEHRGGPLGTVGGPVTEVDPGAAVLACPDSPVEGSTAVDVLDLVSGELVRRVELPGARNAVEVGDGVATFEVDEGGQLVGRRWSLLTGEPVWEHRGARVTWDVQTITRTSDDERMTLDVDGVSLTLDLRTGEPVAAAPDGGPAPQVLDRLTLPDGGTAVSTAVADGRVELVVSDADGDQRFSTAGYAVTPVVDDGTAPGTLLIHSAGREGVMALDPRTGDELWRSAETTHHLAVLSGRVVLRGEERIMAVDARTGETVWTHEAPAPASGASLVTDGRVVLTLALVDGDPLLQARDAQTGEEVWQAPAPLVGGSLRVLPDGRVLVAGSDETVVLAP
jgi:hypothetical protein